MKLLRISASLCAFSAIALLAACGGGGGGGGATPPTSPGGGSPPPSSSPSTPPTTPPTTPPSGTVSSNGSIVVAQDGTATSPMVFGKDNWQTNGVTDKEGAGDGDLTTGYTSTNGGPFDGANCNLPGEPTSNALHVHSFLGIFVNGTQYAIPDAIGMLNSSGDGAGATQPFPNETFSNACTIHTHSTSGIIHIEDNSAAQSYTSQPAQYNLQTLLDIWGQSSISNVAAAAASGFSGPVSIYVGTPCPNNAVGCASPQKNSKTGDDLVTTYTLQTGAPSSILFGHHVAVWVIVGSMPAAGLPAIDFGLAN